MNIAQHFEEKCQKFDNFNARQKGPNIYSQSDYYNVRNPTEQMVILQRRRTLPTNAQAKHDQETLQDSPVNQLRAML